MAKKFVVEQPWFGSFTPFDPNAPPALVLPAEEPLPVPEAVAPVPNTWPAGQTYEGFLYSLIQDLEASVDAMSGGSEFTTDITTPNDGDVLIYDSGSSTWINVTQDSVIGGPYLPLVGGTITGTPGTLVVNAPNGETGAILTAQVDGSRRFLVDADGDAVFELTDTANTGPTATVQISHRTSSGTPTTGFGSSLQFWGEDSAHTRVHYGTVRTEASDTTPAAVSADLVLLNQQAGASVEVLRFRSDGRGQFASSIQGPSAHIGDITTHPATLHVSRSTGASNPSVATYFRVKSVADTSLAQGSIDVEFDFGTTHQLVQGGGTLAAQQSMVVSGATYSATGALTITEATGVFLNSLPVAGTNVTLSNRYALYVNGPSRFESGASGGITYVWRLPLDDTPVGASVGRIPVNINGTLRYVPYHAA